MTDQNRHQTSDPNDKPDKAASSYPLELPLGAEIAEASFRKGSNIVFKDNSKTIRIWGSGWTGREKIWVNDKLVSDRRSFGFNPWHRFDFDDHLYEVIINVDGENFGAILVSILKDGVLTYRAQTNNVTKTKNGKPSLAYAISVLIGAIAGFLVMTAVLHSLG